MNSIPMNKALVILAILISLMLQPNHSFRVSGSQVSGSTEGDDGEPTLVIIDSDGNPENANSGLGPSWGAVAVAEHNSRPWEDPQQDDTSEEDSLSSIPVSDLFDDPNSISNVPIITSSSVNQPSLDPSVPIIGAAEMHTFPHQNRPSYNYDHTTPSPNSTSSSIPTPTRYPLIHS